MRMETNKNCGQIQISSFRKKFQEVQPNFKALNEFDKKGKKLFSPTFGRST